MLSLQVTWNRATELQRIFWFYFTQVEFNTFIFYPVKVLSIDTSLVNPKLWKHLRWPAKLPISCTRPQRLDKAFGQFQFTWTILVRSKQSMQLTLNVICCWQMTPWESIQVYRMSRKTSSTPATKRDTFSKRIPRLWEEKWQCYFYCPLYRPFIMK